MWSNALSQVTITLHGCIQCHLSFLEYLGHSEYSHEAAKERLDHKFSSQRKNWKISNPLDSSNYRIENFMDLFDFTVTVVKINVEEAGRPTEFGNGSLYLKFKQKTIQPMLACYHHWV